MAFHLFKVEQNRLYRLSEPVDVLASVPYSTAREAVLRLFLGEGRRVAAVNNAVITLCRYVVIPSSMAAGWEGPFLLRILTPADAHCHSLVKYNPTKDWRHTLRLKR